MQPPLRVVAHLSALSLAARKSSCISCALRCLPRGRTRLSWAGAPGSWRTGAARPSLPKRWESRKRPGRAFRCSCGAFLRKPRHVVHACGPHRLPCATCWATGEGLVSSNLEASTRLKDRLSTLLFVLSSFAFFSNPARLPRAGRVM